MRRGRRLAALAGLVAACSAAACSRSDPAPAPAPAVEPARSAAAEAAERPADAGAPDPAIGSKEHARRLARAIYADLYVTYADQLSGIPAERVAAVVGTDLVDAGNAFKSGIDPIHWHVFDEELDGLVRAASDHLLLDSAVSARAFADALVRAALREPEAGRAGAVDEARVFFRERAPRRRHAVFDAVLAKHRED